MIIRSTEFCNEADSIRSFDVENAIINWKIKENTAVWMSKINFLMLLLEYINEKTVVFIQNWTSAQQLDRALWKPQSAYENYQLKLWTRRNICKTKNNFLKKSQLDSWLQPQSASFDILINHKIWNKTQPSVNKTNLISLNNLNENHFNGIKKLLEPKS
jgi:transcription-repair coupling factor (superfamily II helicase)